MNDGSDIVWFLGPWGLLAAVGIGYGIYVNRSYEHRFRADETVQAVVQDVDCYSPRSMYRRDLQERDCTFVVEGNLANDPDPQTVGDGQHFAIKGQAYIRYDNVPNNGQTICAEIIRNLASDVAYRSSRGIKLVDIEFHGFCNLEDLAKNNDL
jgi:hypothetical protein